MTESRVSGIVRKCFAAYLKNRAALEDLLSEDFVFSSPYDDRIDRKTYFCALLAAQRRSA
jgi:hypothetical protein